MKRIIQFSLFIAFTIFSINNVCAQNNSSKGKDFWFGYMTNQNSSSGPIYTYVSSSSSSPITGTISVLGLSWSQNFVVAPNSTIRITMPNGIQPSFTENTFNLAVHVSCSDSVSVYSQSAVPYADEATLIYPTPALGNKYMILNWSEMPGYYDGGDEVLIVATHDSTQIQITPSIATSSGHPAGIPYTITLSQGQTYQITDTLSNQSLTGTTIQSINSSQGILFAVFSGDLCTDIGPCYACEHLYEQLLPIASLGNEYILPPLKDKDTTYYRIMSINNSTQVTINGGTPITLNAGQYYQFSNNIASYVTANNKIMIMQYANGGTCGDSVGDPFEILMYPNNQIIDNVKFDAFPAVVLTDYRVNVIVKTADVTNTLLDGINIASNFSTLPYNNIYSYAQIDIDSGNHTLTNPGGLLAYVYAWGDLESYGYCAGAAMPDIDTTILSVKQNDFEKNLKVYPNPTTGRFKIDLGTTYKNVTIRLTNITGKLLKSKNLTVARIITMQAPDIGGIYILHITIQNEGSSVFKIVKE